MSKLLFRGAVLAALVVLVTAPASAAVRETRTFDADELEVRNLIGEVEVVGHSGSGFEVEILIDGQDASKGLVEIKTREGDRPVLELVFPKEGTFIYPRLGRGSKTNISFDSDDHGWLSGLLRQVTGSGRLEVRGAGNGIEVWADLTIKVPAGGTLDMKHGVGEIHANDVEGVLSLETRSGHVEAREIDGALTVDTGSGHVELAEVRGELSVDTGSGHVTATRIEGPDVVIDTGSGHVELDDVRTKSLDVDTGSGHVKAARLSTDSARIDTGSGGVTLQLDEMGKGSFSIDTGSGGIELAVPEGISANVHAETGSGGVSVDLGDAVKMRRMERDEAEFTIGDGSGSRVTLSTGSGGIRIVKRGGKAEL